VQCPGTGGYSTELRSEDVKWFTALEKKSSRLSKSEVIDIAAAREQCNYPTWLSAPAGPGLWGIVRVLIFGDYLRVGTLSPTLRSRLTGLAAELIKPTLEFAFFSLDFPLQYRANPLVQVPEVVEIHFV
jgi:hypothetical protein